MVLTLGHLSEAYNLLRQIRRLRVHHSPQPLEQVLLSGTIVDRGGLCHCLDKDFHRDLIPTTVVDEDCRSG